MELLIFLAALTALIKITGVFGQSAHRAYREEMKSTYITSHDGERLQITEHDDG